MSCIANFQKNALNVFFIMVLLYLNDRGCGCGAADCQHYDCPAPTPVTRGHLRVKKF